MVARVDLESVPPTGDVRSAFHVESSITASTEGGHMKRTREGSASLFVGLVLLTILAIIAGPVSAQVVQPTDPMAQARVGHTATLLGNGTALIAGGENGAPVADAEVFDPVTKAFSAGGSMLAPRADHTASLVPDGRVLFIGGHDGTGPRSGRLAQIAG
jgi:Galactose oxidase, central domain